MARPRITSIIAKWLFGESITSGEKSTLRASLGAAPATGINPSCIDGTAATITGNNIFLGDNYFNGESTFNFVATFNDATYFNGIADFQSVLTTALTIRKLGNRIFIDSSFIDGDYEQIPANFSGTIPVVPSYPDIITANEDLAAGECFWDTTLKKLRVATS